MISGWARRRIERNREFFLPIILKCQTIQCLQKINKVGQIIDKVLRDWCIFNSTDAKNDQFPVPVDFFGG